MSKNVTLVAEPREKAGSSVSRRLRTAGRVPVNVFGHGEANANLSVDAHELDLALHTAAQVFMLKQGQSEQACLVRNVQYDTFGQQVLHVDFARVDLSEEVEVEVELAFIGFAKGVADGGTLAVQHPALWVKCRADSIPERIEVDVTGVEVGHALHAREIVLPAGVRLDTHKMGEEAQIVGVVAAHIEVAPVAAAAEGEAAPAAEGAAAAAPAAGAKGEAAPAAKGAAPAGKAAPAADKGKGGKG